MKKIFACIVLLFVALTLIAFGVNAQSINRIEGDIIRLQTRSGAPATIDIRGNIFNPSITLGTVGDSVIVLNGGFFKVVPRSQFVTDLSSYATLSYVNSQFATTTSTNTALGLKADKNTTLTINGVTQDISTNRSWTVSGGPQVGTYATMKAIISPSDGQQFHCTDYLPGLWYYSSFANDWLYSQSPIYNIYFAIYNTGGIAHLTNNFGGTGATNTALLNGGGSTGGFMRLETGTTSTGFAGYGFNPFSTGIGFIGANNPSQKMAFRFRVKLNQLSTSSEAFTMTLGHLNAPSNQNVIAFIYTHSTNGGKWLARCSSNSVTTDQDTNVAADTNWHDFLFLVSSTSARFYIDGILTTTITTGIPTNSTNVGSAPGVNGLILRKTAGTSNVTANVDFLKIYNYNNN